MPSSPATCSAQEKRAALDAVLSSRSFERSEQLKRFLRYICEQEMAGRGEEVTEYSIGVEGLGRPPDFSPNDDSCVRNRAFALRKKLEEFYEQEAPDAPLRIELPKGNYLPRFVAAEPDPAPPLPQLVPAVEPPRQSAPERRSPAGLLVLMLLAGLVIGALVTSLRYRGRLIPDAPPSFQAAWGGMLRPGAHVLVSVATPPHTYIREFPDLSPRNRYRPVDKGTLEWYLRQKREAKLDGVLLQVPTFNSPLWGDAAGSFGVARMLQRYGAEPELLAERLVSPPVFRNRNAVMLGNPEYSPTIQELLRNMPLRLGYDTAARDYEVFEVDAHGAVVRRFLPKRDGPDGPLLEVFGLITWLPSQGDGEQHARTVVLSGISSAGTEAAAEYVTAPGQIEDLARRIGIRPGDPWPPRLQVLIRASSNRTMPLSFSYETHRIPSR